MTSPQSDQHEHDEVKEHRRAVNQHLRIELFSYIALPILFLGALTYSIITLPWATNWVSALYLGIIILGSVPVLMKLSNPYMEFWTIYGQALKGTQKAIEGGKQG